MYVLVISELGGVLKEKIRVESTPLLFFHDTFVSWASWHVTFSEMINICALVLVGVSEGLYKC